MTQVLGPKNRGWEEPRTEVGKKDCQKSSLREDIGSGGWIANQGVISSPAEGKGKSSTENFRTDLC